MKSFKEKFNKTEIEYFLSGENPQIFFDSGTHGDEYEVIDSLTKAILKYTLPPIIFIPRVSPSAVAQKTRVNKENKDLNRIFFPDSKDEEVIANINLRRKFPVNILFSFHEDPSTKDFYLYDSDELSKEQLEKLLTRVKSLGINLFNGIDDPDLNEMITDGYSHSNETRKEIEYKGLVWDFGLKEKLFKRILMPEIPGKLSKELKDKLVEVLFEELILPLVID